LTIRLRCTVILVLFIVISLSYRVRATELNKEALQLGIFPYVSPGQLVNFHTDLKDRFEVALGKKVVMVTAPSFKKFVMRTKHSSYDFILTAPHLGRLAEVRDGYRPIAHTKHEVQGVYLVNSSSDIYELKGLEGKIITLVGRTALITQMVEKQLNNIGLFNGKNITFKFTKTHNNAMYAPLRGESDASVTGILLWYKIGKLEKGNKMRVIGKSPESIGFQVMAAADVPETDVLKVQKALFSFHESDVGKKYMVRTGFKRFDIVDDQEKKQLEPYIQVFLKKQ